MSALLDGDAAVLPDRLLGTPAVQESPRLLEVEDAQVWRAGADGERQYLLHETTWSVRAGERWAVLGPNGAGKSTLLSLAAAVDHPSAGTVRVLGHTLGRVDMRALRRHIGLINPAQPIPPDLSVLEYVLTGTTGTVALLPEGRGAAEHGRADDLLDVLGIGPLASRPMAVCSQGERARARIARALMPQPELLLLDEPTSGLDLVARETLLAALDGLTQAWPRLAMVMVVHHFEDLPNVIDQVLLLRGGRTVASGPIHTVLTAASAAATFGMPLDVECRDGRWAARRQRPAPCGQPAPVAAARSVPS